MIDIVILIENAKKKYNISLMNNATIKEVSINLCNKLGLDSFSTNITFYSKNGFNELSQTSTLRQNFIKNKDCLIAKLDLKNSKKSLKNLFKRNLSEGHKKQIIYVPKIKSPELCGILVKGFCVNKLCVSYNKMKDFSLGMGFFSLNKLVGNLKCDVCPYKSVYLNPSIIVADIMFNKCFWKIIYSYENRGIISKKEVKTFNKASNIVKIDIEKIKNELNYIDLVFEVKNL